MAYYPSLEEFRELARQWNLVPVYRQLTGDTLTPVSAFCKIEAGDWAFLFESVVGGERLGRYSFLGSRPFLLFEAYGPRVRIARHRHDGTEAPAVEEREDPDPLRLLEERLAAYRAPHLPAGGPGGGALGGRRPGAALPLQLHARGVRGGRRAGHRVHQGRRHLPGGAQPAPPDGDHGPPLRHLPDPAGR